jgi:quercetin dioxygenase-like cupin family protein
MKILALAFALTILPASVGLAQTTPAAPKSLLENEQIKVREIRMAPGARQPSATHPNTFLYALTDGSIVFTPPGRKGYELIFKAGEALWLPSQETATSNEGDKEVRALLVEIKGRAPAAAKKGRAPKATKGSKKAAPKR